MSTKTTDQEISVSLEVIDSELSYTENKLGFLLLALTEDRYAVTVED